MAKIKLARVKMTRNVSVMSGNDRYLVVFYVEIKRANWVGW